MKYNHPLDDSYIGTSSISQEILEQTFDFQITYTLFGEVLAVTCNFLELPEEAQRLTVGKKYDQIRPIIEGYTNVYPYFVPFVAMGKLTTGKWADLYTDIKILQSSANLNRLPIDQYIVDNWTHDMYEYVRAKKKHTHFIDLISEDKEKRANALYGITSYQTELPGPLLYELIPITLPSNELEKLYSGLEKYPYEKYYKLLSAHLKDDSKKSLHSAILIGLKPYKYPHLHQLLINYIEEHPNSNYRVNYYLIENLEKFSSTKVDTFLKEKMLGNDTTIAKKAFNALKKKGWEEATLNTLLQPLLADPTKTADIKKALTIYTEFKNKLLVPTTLDIIQYTFTIWEKDRYKETNYIHALLVDRVDSKDYDYIIPKLSSKQRTDTSSSLSLLQYIGQREHIPSISPQLVHQDIEIVKQSIQTIREIIYRNRKKLTNAAIQEHILVFSQYLNSEDTSLRTEALTAIKKILPLVNTTSADSIPLLLKLYETAQRGEKNLLIEVLGLIARSHPEKRILDLLLEATNSQEHYTKIAALAALGNFKRPEVIKTLEKFQDAEKEDSAIRRTAKESLEKLTSSTWKIKKKMRAVDTMVDFHMTFAETDDLTSSQKWLVKKMLKGKYLYQEFFKK